jgi:hypothetical protein
MSGAGLGALEEIWTRTSKSWTDDRVMAVAVTRLQETVTGG